MSYFNAYYSKLVGGYTKISKLKLQPGHLVSFNYSGERNRKITRLVFILNTHDTRGGTRLVHGMNLENINFTTFMRFIKRILVDDTITLIKRKYEIKGPIGSAIDRPLTFYTRHLKPRFGESDYYRTYKIGLITNLKLWALDYSGLFNKTDENLNLLISSKQKISNIISERNAFKDIFDIDTMKLKDRKYKQLILQRFGSEEVFKKSVLEINEMILNGEEEI